jgi:hypothetical protein
VIAPTRLTIFSRTLGIALLLATASGAARAQEEPLSKPTWALKAGAFFPTSGTLKNQSASPYYVIGVEIDPNFRYRPANGRIAFSAEAFYRKHGTVDFLTIPLTARITWNITNPDVNGRRVYGGLGVGAYFIGTQFEGNTLQPGARFVLGADLNKRWFFETNYDYISGFTDSAGFGVKPSGLSLQIGYRY